jgi:hypothetical protein
MLMQPAENLGDSEVSIAECKMGRKGYEISP